MDRATAFDHAATQRLSPTLALRREAADDAPFLDALFAACSPLAGLLPATMVQHQASCQREQYRSAYPEATWTVILALGTPIARIVIDWSDPQSSRCVDIAVLPERQRQGIGGGLLRGWLDVTDAHAVPALLVVARDNRANALYEELGFRPDRNDDPTLPHASLRRAPSGST